MVPGPRLAYIANLARINGYRNLPKFTGATESIVDDSTYPPRMLGSQLLESTTMTAAVTAASKVTVFR